MNQATDSNAARETTVRLPTSRYIIFFALAAGGLACDLITKRVVFANYFDPNLLGAQHWWIDGVFGIECSTNGGALFGMFQGGSFWLALLSMAALLAILYWLFFRRMARNLLLTISLALVTGGILGNLYDRMGFGHISEHGEATKYHVRDWIHFRLSGVPMFDPWPNFNIADSLLVCGAMMLFIFAFFGSEKPSGVTRESAATAPEAG